MICGFDEAGRGPLAGPVCAAAAILPEDFPREALDDSKKLSAKKRDSLAALIYEKAFAWGIGWASPAEIDRLNILRASLLAMRRAFLALLVSRLGPMGVSQEVGAIRDKGLEEAALWDRVVPKTLPALIGEGLLEGIADGPFAPDVPLPCRGIVKGDGTIPEVMAASILAKTARDRAMLRYSWLYPEYGYEKHKGYPTREHRSRIAQAGPSPIQRMSFSWKPSGD